MWYLKRNCPRINITGSSWWYVNIGATSHYLNQQAITWTNVDLDPCRDMASPGHNELTASDCHRLTHWPLGWDSNFKCNLRTHIMDKSYRYVHSLWNCLWIPQNNFDVNFGSGNGLVLPGMTKFQWLLNNKANPRDLIAATGLVISNWIQIVDFSACVTLKFDGWPRKTIGHFFYTMSSFVHHFKSIGEFKLELQSGNAQFGSKLVIFCPVWPWIWWMTLKNKRTPLL